MSDLALALSILVLCCALGAAILEVAAVATHVGRVCERCGNAFLTPHLDICLCRPCYTGGAR